MKAKDIQVGDKFKDDGEAYWTVSAVRPTSGFKMALEGHPNKPAIMVTWKGSKGDWTLYHPDEDVGEPVKRAA